MKQIIVLGCGESGLSAAMLAKKQGYDVFLSDNGTITSENKALLDKAKIAYEEGGHQLRDLQMADEVIKSPGIPDHAEVIRRCIDLDLPVISEIEFAARYIGDSKLIAITGSNGKTTTTSLIAHMLQSTGHYDAIACGNIGKSLARCVLDDPHKYYVIELSSFQLDHMYRFRADIAVLMNITPDHLDRYNHSLALYGDAKGRVFNNQTEEDLAIYMANDPETLAMLRRRTAPLQARVLTFALDRNDMFPYQAAYTEQGNLHLIYNSQEYTISRDKLPLPGEHNLYNMMAASLVCLSLGLTLDELRTGLLSFKAVEHRMEPVAAIRGVRYINDSKATNIDSCHYALAAMPDHKTVVLLGGTDKGNDYNMIKPLIEQKAKALIYLTVDSKKLHETFDPLHDRIPAYDAQSIDEAFRILNTLPLEKDDVVLLSPACASFDLFKNYEYRGREFKEAVHALEKRVKAEEEKGAAF